MALDYTNRFMRKMAMTVDSSIRIPVICIDKSSIDATEIFHSNSWYGASKGIIQSCWAEYSVLNFCIRQITDICHNPERVCREQIKTILHQWQIKKFDLKKVTIFSEVTELHIHIEAFFSEVKTLLDLLVQLLSSEKIVGVSVNGFHKDKKVYGGMVINALSNNALINRKEEAAKIKAIIYEHKSLWIDKAICARDQLIHPTKGIHQLMFQLEFTEKAEGLVFVKANPPEIDSVPIDQYAQRILRHASAFSSSFLGLMR